MKPLLALKAIAVAALALLLAMPAGAQGVKVGKDIHLDHGWDSYTSHTECGGLRRDGKPQPACKSKPANYVGPALGKCPDGSFFDIGLWQCWSCDKTQGYSRTAAAVDTDRACARPATAREVSEQPRFKPATFVGKLCPMKADDMNQDAFFDSIRGGECWSCPHGYEMNVLVRVDAPDKCTRRARELFSFAELSFRTGNPGQCVNRADGTDKGQLVFWDAHNFNGQGAGCWKCPVGYGRSAAPVYANTACSRVEPPDNRPATVRGVAKCEAGTVTDPRNGGECWKCPATYDRTGNAVNSGQACETTPTTVFAKATMISALTCPADQTFDLVKVDNAALADLKRNGRADAAAKAAPDGGTCWKCPPNHKRTFSAVTAGDACQGEKTEWYSAPYKEPGLLGLDGAEQVVEEILTYDRKLVDDTIREVVKQCAASNTADAVACRADPNKEIAAAWTEIAKSPGQSPVLVTLAFGRIAQAALEGSAPLPKDVRATTAADRQLMRAFADYMKKRRTYVAEEALKAFDSWNTTNEALRDWARKEAAKNNTPFMEQVGAPPDWHQMTEDAMLSSLAGVGIAAGGTTVAVMTNPALYNKVFPHAAKTLEKLLAQHAGKGFTKEFTEEFGKKGLSISKKFAQKIVAEAGKETGKGALKFLKAAGPAFVVTAIVEVVVELAINFDEYAKTDRPHLLTMIANAKQPLDLRRDFSTDERTSIASGYWTMAISGDGVASPMAAARIKAVADSMVASVSATWTQLPGEAVDVGASANALWVVGTNPVPGGYGLHRWDGKTFVPMSGGAVRIDLDPSGNPWVVNNTGQILRWTGSAWTLLPGDKAQDIGVGANGTAWYVGGAKVSGGYSVFRWNATANKWDAMSGGGVRIDVDPQGNAWMVNDAGQIWRWSGGNWAGVPGKARDIGIGPEGSVFAVGTDGSVVRWDGAAWVARDGNLNEISVGPGGIPVGINGGKQIWLGYP